MRALRRPSTYISLFLLFLLLTAFGVTVRADDDTDEYDETARVARVSFVRGDVQLKRSGAKNWEDARPNFPLVEGDVLATTGQDARLEIQIDARNFIRLGGDSLLRVVTLRNEGVAFSLSEGVMTVRLARFDRNKEYFEIDAPGTTLAAERQGVYRLDAEAGGRVRLAVRDGGQARIYSETSGFTLRDGRTALLVSGGTDAGDWELGRADSFDTFDKWVDEREQFLASRLRYDGRDRYYDQDVWGAEELDAYGDWIYVNDYGWIWRPYRTAINNYSNWAPYRYGHWVWCPPYGWTWVGDEPWGWAPYHYGRWVYYNDDWCWVPRGYGYPHRRAWWRPALVVFVYIPTTYGERVCWYPLGYGQRDPRGRNYQRLEALRSNDLARLQRTNPAYLRAITTLPARDFGRQSARGEPAPTQIARRAVTAEPVRGRLPITPVEGRTDADGTERRVPRGLAARLPRGVDAGQTIDPQTRPTGAATRTPGVALDNELRQTRLYNGREPRAASGGGGEGRVGTGASGNSSGVDTGAVARPARAPRANGPATERTPQGSSTDSPWYERPARPGRMNPGEEGRTPASTTTPTIERPARSDAPEVTPAPDDRRRVPSGRVDEGGEPVTRPPRREGRPETRPESRPEPRPETRPEPQAEPERRPEPRPERVPESRPEPRSEPSRPEPRAEPRPEPRREPESRPEPRSEPRQESPRSEPRQESPRSEPKQESPREEPKPAPQPAPQRNDDTARPPRRGDGR